MTNISDRQLRSLRYLVAMVERRGYHPLAARNLVIDAIKRAHAAQAGLGQDLFAESPEDTRSILEKAAQIEAVKKAREMVSPWLWVTSLVGFGMALLNSRRIAIMFGKYKRTGRVQAA